MSISAFVAMIVAGLLGHGSSEPMLAAAAAQNLAFPEIRLEQSRYGHTAYTTPTPASSGITYAVSTAADFAKKLATVKDEDTIILNAGKYDLGALSLNRATAKAYVTIKGKTADCTNTASAHITGSTKIKVVSDYWRLENLCFDSIGRSTTLNTFDIAITVFGDHVAIVRNTFANLGILGHPVIVVQVGGGAATRRQLADITISGNVFRNIAGIGLSFPQPAPSYTGGYRWALRPQVTHNSFLSSPRVLSNGGEAIILGTGWDLSPLLSDTIGANVSRNVFSDWDGDNEIVSVKSSGNTVSDNVILNSSGHINVRVGDNNVIERNLIDSHTESSCYGLRSSGKGNLFQHNVLDLSPSCHAFVLTPLLYDTSPYPDKSYTIAYYAGINNYFRWNTVRGGLAHILVMKNSSNHKWLHTPPQASDLPSSNTFRLNTFYSTNAELKYQIDLDPSILTISGFIQSNKIGTDNVFYSL